LRSTAGKARSDIPIVLLCRIYQREIHAAAEGKPIKRWRLPREKLVLGFQPATE